VPALKIADWVVEKAALRTAPQKRRACRGRVVSVAGGLAVAVQADPANQVQDQAQGTSGRRPKILGEGTMLVVFGSQAFLGGIVDLKEVARRPCVSSALGFTGRHQLGNGLSDQLALFGAAGGIRSLAEQRRSRERPSGREG
jgi:hypothetical protein